MVSWETALIILAVVVIVGIVVALRRRDQQQRQTGGIEDIYFRGRRWLMPSGVRADILSRIDTRERRFVLRIDAALRGTDPISQQEMVRYNVLVAAAVDEVTDDEPGKAVYLTEEAQAILRRRQRGER